MKKIISLTILLLILTPNVHTQQTQPRIYVKVDIDAESDIQDKVASYIKRELRSFPDVVVTDDNPDFILHLMVMDSIVGQRRTGFFMSGVFMYPFTEKVINSIAYDMPDSAKETLTRRTKGMIGYVKHYGRTGGTENLKEMCQDVVVQFDKYMLEKRRNR